MVVFSDGEDLNSEYKENDVIKAAEALAVLRLRDRLHAGTNIDPFLAKFTEGNNGEI
jgi:hypothetical protein